MRIKIRFKPTERQTESLPIEYRGVFISFIKSSLYDRFPHIFENRLVKPYTFAVLFNKGVKFNKREITGIERMDFIFSSGDPEILTAMFNFAIGLRRGKGWDKIKKEEIRKFRLTKVSPVWREYRGENTFRILSPVVVNDPHKNPRNPKEHYLLPGDEGFNRRLLEITVERMERFLGRTPKGGIEVEPVEKVKEVMVRHYKGYVRGFIGTIKVKAPPNVLKFIYDYGLGIRTGQGFGMLEVIPS